MAGGVFKHWGELWATYERPTTGVFILNWARATGDYVTVPPQGPMLTQLVQRLQTASMTPEQVKAQLMEGRLSRLQQRPGYAFHDWPPRWGTFAQHEPPPQRAHMGADWLFGWPCPCLWLQVHAKSFDNTVFEDELHGGILLSGQPSAVIPRFRALPMRPMWSGLIINAIVFSATWMVLLLAPACLRRSLRRRQGRCLKCGYDLRDKIADGCPECGSGRDAAVTGLSAGC